MLHDTTQQRVPTHSLSCRFLLVFTMQHTHNSIPSFFIPHRSVSLRMVCCVLLQPVHTKIGDTRETVQATSSDSRSCPPPQFNSQVVHISDEIGASMSQSLHRELGCKEFNSLCCNQTQMGPNLKEWQFSIQ